MAKKELPQHIKEFYDKDKKVRKLVDTTESVHSEAYQKAAETLRDEKGEIDYEKLEEVRNQDNFLEKMVDHYLNAAVKSLGLKKRPQSELDQDILLQQYIGTTRGELKRILREAKSNYTLQQHEGIRDELIKKQRQRLHPLRGSHFEEEHIEDILKHVGADKYVAKDRAQLPHAISLLDHYRQKGELTLSDLATITSTSPEKGGWGSDIYLTDKAKEGIKELKKKYKQTA